jgi:hypothetical protein
VAQARPRWSLLGAQLREPLAYSWIDASVRLLAARFERLQNEQAAGLIETLPTIRDVGSLLRARAVLRVVLRSQERLGSAASGAVLSAMSFLHRFEAGPDIAQACLFAVMASRSHFGDDRFVDALIAELPDDSERSGQPNREP